jgi:hypothetical protein
VRWVQEKAQHVTWFNEVWFCDGGIMLLLGEMGLRGDGGCWFSSKMRGEIVLCGGDACGEERWFCDRGNVFPEKRCFCERG